MWELSRAAGKDANRVVERVDWLGSTVVARWVC